MSAKYVARFGLLTAMALVLGYVERFIPVPIPAPGVKIGLANTVLLYAVYLMDWKSALLLMVVKVLLSGLLFSGVSGMMYAFAGGALSLAVMLLLRKAKGMSIVGTSIAGAAAHNVGQVLVACLMVNTRAMIGYLPVLLISGVITGLLTGMVAKLVIDALSHMEGSR